MLIDEDMECAKYVFGEAKHDRRLTRSVELRTKSFNPVSASRTFSNEPDDTRASNGMD
jgi:hypothetical protein